MNGRGMCGRQSHEENIADKWGERRIGSRKGHLRDARFTGQRHVVLSPREAQPNSAKIVQKSASTMSNQTPVRSEEAIFADLESLVAEPGYAHTIAWLCVDGFFRYSDRLKPKSISEISSGERLIETEISTLVGLLVKSNLDFTPPTSDMLESMLKRSGDLFRELHNSIMPSSIDPSKWMREAIFYSGESAYYFQSRDFSRVKYAKDQEWIKSNKGFSVGSAQAVARAILKLQQRKVKNAFNSFNQGKFHPGAMLSAYMLTTKEVAAAACLDYQIVDSVFNAFSLPSAEKNDGFNSVSDFNHAKACPLIEIEKGKYLLYQYRCFTDSLYESPSYWMTEDPGYADQAAKNRGEFAEQFCANCMRGVFGDGRVYENVHLREDKRTTVGEIDVLVVFGDRAIVIQAKSKGLTIESRRGNDNKIRDDFKRAVQDSYDQGLKCAKAILEKGVRVLDKDGWSINVPKGLKEIYILCVLSEQYPSLPFQTRQFLRVEKTKQIMEPFVMDVFLLDTMTEMLRSPLYFLSYINRRTTYGDSVFSTNELAVLDCHLKINLWLGTEIDGMFIDESDGSSLDEAMMARREKIPGQMTPDGILTRFKDTSIERIIRQIEHMDDPNSIGFGFMLLTMGEFTVRKLDEGINEVVCRSCADRDNHDFTISVPEDPATSQGRAGITIHCNFYSERVASELLSDHCMKRKYICRADTWFGLCFNPKTTELRFGMHLNFPWQQSDKMDKFERDFLDVNKKKSVVTTSERKRLKIGRNSPCPCGSGKKYKKCCLRY